MSRVQGAGRIAAMAMMVALGACQGGSLAGSPEGIPVAIESIDGAPTPVKTALINELGTAASTRKVELVGSSAQARYRVRGYLSTETDEGETKIAYVWDVFDAQKQRAKRLAGSKSVSAGAISSLDKAALAQLAQSSMDDIAAFLSESKADDPIQTAAASGEEPPIATQ
jgi:hypothetical protein